MTVTFFRSKAERILSSVASPFARRVHVARLLRGDARDSAENLAEDFYQFTRSLSRKSLEKEKNVFLKFFLCII